MIDFNFESACHSFYLILLASVRFVGKIFYKLVPYNTKILLFCHEFGPRGKNALASLSFVTAAFPIRIRRT